MIYLVDYMLLNKTVAKHIIITGTVCVTESREDRKCSSHSRNLARHRGLGVGFRI